MQRTHVEAEEEEDALVIKEGIVLREAKYNALLVAGACTHHQNKAELTYSRSSPCPPGVEDSRRKREESGEERGAENKASSRTPGPRPP